MFPAAKADGSGRKVAPVFAR